MKGKGAKKTRPEAQRLKKTKVYRALYTLASWEMVEDIGRTRTEPSGQPARAWALCDRLQVTRLKPLFHPRGNKAPREGHFQGPLRKGQSGRPAKIWKFAIPCRRNNR
jgi:hypothetical protein